MPVHGNHYVALDNPGGFTAYPGQAYLPNPTGGGRGRWVWDEKRPRYIGEDFFFTGNHPELATIGGEAALTGKAATLARLRADAADPPAGLPLGRLRRRGTSTAAPATPTTASGSTSRRGPPSAGSGTGRSPPGKTVKRTLGDLQRHALRRPDRLHLGAERRRQEGGGRVEGVRGRAGDARGVRADAADARRSTARAEGELILSLSVGGQGGVPATSSRSRSWPRAAGRATGWTDAADADGLYVYDPAGEVAAFLKAARRTVHAAAGPEDAARGGEGAARRQGRAGRRREHVQPAGGVRLGRADGDRAGAEATR